MNDELKFFLIYIFPILIYFLSWMKLRRFSSIKPQIVVWLSFVFLLFLIGMLSYKKGGYNEISHLGNGILYTGSLLLLGPTLMLVKSKKSKFQNVKIGFTVVLMPVLGIVFTFLMLLIIGGITGL